MKRLVLLGFLVIGGVGAANAAGKAPDPFVGEWRWTWTHGHPIVVNIRSDGSARVVGQKYSGAWKLVPSDAGLRKYQIVWQGGSNIDVIELSDEGNNLTGESAVSRARISAKRLSLN